MVNGPGLGGGAEIGVQNMPASLRAEMNGLSSGASGGATEKSALKEITEELKKPGVDSTDLTKTDWNWSAGDVEAMLNKIHASGELPPPPNTAIPGASTEKKEKPQDQPPQEQPVEKVVPQDLKYKVRNLFPKLKIGGGISLAGLFMLIKNAFKRNQEKGGVL